jgi:hypothetical protein
MVHAAQPNSSDRDKLRVFISFDRDDMDFAVQLNAALNVCGFECVIDRQGISAGEDWKRRLGDLISWADAVVFVLSPSSANSEILAWEVEEAARFGKRIVPVKCRPFEGEGSSSLLRALSYIFFHADPKVPSSGFGTGLAAVVAALNTDFGWVREHTRYLQRAIEWDANGRPVNRLLSGNDIAEAKAWVGHRPQTAPEPTDLQLDFIRTSEKEAAALGLAREPRTCPPSRIFISYRREDSKWPARQIYNAFLRHLPNEQVFMDIDSIPPGADFVETLQGQVRQCEIVLALIGPGWAGYTDPKTGQRRLENPKDFVRIEICAAFSRAIPVVPVLLDGARMPDVEQLPEDMRTLSRRQAEFVEYRTFDADVDRLIRRLGFGNAKDVVGEHVRFGLNPFTNFMATLPRTEVSE